MGKCESLNRHGYTIKKENITYEILQYNFMYITSINNPGILQFIHKIQKIYTFIKFTVKQGYTDNH